MPLTICMALLQRRLPGKCTAQPANFCCRSMPPPLLIRLRALVRTWKSEPESDNVVSAVTIVLSRDAAMDAKVKTRKILKPRKPARTTERVPELQYQPGFGNQFVTEAVPGALPVGRNSPQKPPHGLYAELISGTAFTAPRHENRRTWTYRIQPSVVHRPYQRIDNGPIRSAPFDDVEATPSQLRWSPFPIPKKATDFVQGIVTVGGNGNVATQTGMAAHIYAANTSTTDRYFYNADGEMLVLPQQGRARFVTELGVVDTRPGEIALLPRGLRFKVELPDGP